MAAALYRRQIDGAELERLRRVGLAAVADQPPVPVWPCCRLAVLVFLGMGTQWIQGAGGPTGLQYGLPLSRVLRAHGVPPAQRDQVFADLQVLEGAALRTMHERNPAD